MLAQIVFTIAALQANALAQSCPSLTANYPAPSVALGYEAKLVAQGLKVPRGLIFDNNNNLLVLERGTGVTSFAIDVTGSCVTLKDKKTLVGDNTVSYPKKP
jgi:glucose/arabinose dehydrogenase